MSKYFTPFIIMQCIYSGGSSSKDEYKPITFEETMAKVDEESMRTFDQWLIEREKELKREEEERKRKQEEENRLK